MYGAVHQWLRRKWVKMGICECCEKICKTQWANKSGEYDRFDVNDWFELCPSCHAYYDSNVYKFMLRRIAAKNF